MKVKFLWDEKKNLLNKKKHGVDFQEAASIFENLPLEVFHDPDHSLDEDRYIAIGWSFKNRMLLVVHIENSIGKAIRIISARKIKRSEIKSIFGGKK